MEKLEAEIRRKFIKDTNLPIQILESPYFEYFLDLYNQTLNSRTLWNSFQKEIKESFEGRPGKYLEYTRELEDKILSNILNSPEYIKFNGDKELDDTLKETPEEIRKNLYSGANIGKKFLAIDLKKANFQAFHWYDPGIVLGKDTWEEFLGHYTTSKSFINSKNLRQILLGKTNPSRLIRIEKYLIWKITELVTPYLSDGFTLFSRMTDEVIWEVPEDYTPTGDLEEKLVELIKNSLGIDVKTLVFSLTMIQKFTHSGKSITGFIKDFAWPVGKISELKDTPKMYYSQIYKAWKGLDINTVYDLVMYCEGELARFDYPLSSINPR